MTRVVCVLFVVAGLLSGCAGDRPAPREVETANSGGHGPTTTVPSAVGRGDALPDTQSPADGPSRPGPSSNSTGSKQGAATPSGADRAPTCRELKHAADTEEERVALRGRCHGTSDPWSNRTVAASSEHEPVSWDRLAQWWPERPLLRPVRAPAGTTVRPYAWSWRGGTKADPRVDGASAGVICDTAAASVETHDVVGIAAGGGFVLMHLSHAVSDAFPPASDAHDLDTGRGPGKEWTITLDSDRAVRTTTWREGDTVMVLYSSGSAHTSADVRTFISSLEPL